MSEPAFVPTWLDSDQQRALKSSGRRQGLREVVDLAERKRVLGQIPPWQEEFVRELVKELET